MRRRSCLFIAAIAAVFGAIRVAAPAARQADAGDNVILVTLDGVRTEELFGGLDFDILTSTLRDGQKAEETAAYKRFWASTREERRAKLMPFFWSLVTEEGSVAGDAASGSAVRLRNGHWFSYPGYAEILLGEPHDAQATIRSAPRSPPCSRRFASGTSCRRQRWRRSAAGACSTRLSSTPTAPRSPVPAWSLTRLAKIERLR